MRKMIILAILLLSACAPSAEAVQQSIRETQSAWTPVATQTDYPTYTPAPTYTAPPTVFVTKIVTQTFTPSPVFTATITNTPVPTNTRTATPNPLKLPRGNGFYLVNVDIAPGVWRSDGTNDSCYWSITEADGDIIDNHFGQSGGTAYIPVNAFQVEFSDCGNWTFISAP